MMMASEQILKAYELFSQGEYFKSHEVLEEFWSTYAADDRILYQSLIQLSVAQHLIQEKRFDGAEKVLHRAYKNIYKFLLDHKAEC